MQRGWRKPKSLLTILLGVVRPASTTHLEPSLIPTHSVAVSFIIKSRGRVVTNLAFIAMQLILGCTCQKQMRTWRCKSSNRTDLCGTTRPNRSTVSTQTRSPNGWSIRPPPLPPPRPLASPSSTLPLSQSSPSLRYPPRRQQASPSRDRTCH